uniref:Putative exosomal 3'-5' exoribonuclease complex subunit ski4 n=1 Tax=Ornithodoros turicata TaxID=34597 RepID=A0A2R5L8E1_9ACAR
MFCIPGQRLCASKECFVGGEGTYVQHGYVYSSLSGRVSIKRQQDKKTLVQVKRCANLNIIPTPGNVVTVKITSINPRFCKCTIIAIEESQLLEPFRGIIRKEDIRAFEKDRVDISKSFRVGDIVLARVISIGDAMSYFLTTAENELGVVVALSVAGYPMTPISWTEMQCPVSYVKQFRKVARVPADVRTPQSESS